MNIKSVSTYSNKKTFGGDYSGKFLIGFDFSNSSLEYADFSNSDLSFAVFRRTDLYHANFEGAVLYCTVFEECNLTRAEFKSCYIYGVKFVSFVNVTYCDVDNVKTESLRRIGYKCNPDGDKYIKIKLGSKIIDKNRYKNFVCNGYYIQFKEREPYDKERELSQIYNRLKRIYKENYFISEAADYYYLERYWHRRSLCKQSFSGKEVGNKYKRFILTLWAYIIEITCGYGEKPFNVLKCICSIIIVYGLAYMYGEYENINFELFDFRERLEFGITYSVCNIISYNYNIQPKGLTLILSISEYILGIIFFALFTATLIRSMIRE